MLDTPAQVVRSDDDVRVDGKPLPSVDRARLWRFHKPKGLVTTHTDERGRTTVFDDPTTGDDRNGARILPVLLSTHQPLDLVIILLGTNDIKFANRCRAFDASMGMGRLVQIIQTFPYQAWAPKPQVLIVAPPTLVPTDDEWFNDLWGHAIEESKLFGKHYARVAEEMGVHFFDAGAVAKADKTDGGHLDAENTKAIGTALVPVVKRILNI